ncbi:1,3-beta-galactosyl-N-acetylhexosamine phosphorylase [Candidatus Sumerlaeota bacterium]|nr:1,3-beta-galactosyl-N-acetylhexosamine phosphorylase [Candidatus Sumerlaeota bacterium]
MMTQKLTGRFTLPTQSGMEKETLELAEKWGADAIRDSDGTVLSPELTAMDFEIYSTLCMIRADQDWNNANMHECQQKFLMSDPRMAESGTLVVDIMYNWSDEKFTIDRHHDPARYWEVIDRTTGEVIDTANWSFDKETGKVTIKNTIPWHLYTVNFLVYQIWETTSMYNYIVNHWTGPHQSGIDPYQPATRKHLLEYLDKWIDEHPHTDVVRFTSVAYQFPSMEREDRTTRFQDWCCYLDCISARALDEFEKRKGYRLRSEHLVDAGYYNATGRVPSKEYLDWVDFVNEFTTDFAGEWVKMAHDRGKKAIMFFCDHWIGTEPYGERFPKMGFDGLVTPCINGTELRRVADVPYDVIKEVRLYPYFFPVNLSGRNLFEGEGGDPVGECKYYWSNVRRAMVRRCVDRIGFGGYLSLAVKFPEFLDAVEVVADEFRQIADHSEQGAAYTMPGKVVILNAWGKRRSWICGDVPGGGLLEGMSGLPVDFEFMSFDELKQNGLPENTKVVINYGAADSAWSGGRHWTDPDVVIAIRKFVGEGGGFIGIYEPTAVEHQGRYLQMEELLGVQRHTSANVSNRKLIRGQKVDEHFITADVEGELKFGSLAGHVFATNPGLQILAEQDGVISLAVNTFGLGRSVYLGGYSGGPRNLRMFLRALYWASGQEGEYQKWSVSNPHTECAAFVESGVCAVLNNTAEAQSTTLLDGNGQPQDIELAPSEMKWIPIQ